MTKPTIGFFGHSWCEFRENPHSLEHGYDTWPNMLAQELDADIVHMGRGASSVSDVLIKQWRPLAEQGSLPTYSIFCWPEPEHFYNGEMRGISVHIMKYMLLHRLERWDGDQKEAMRYNERYLGDDHRDLPKWHAALDYYSHLFDWEHAVLAWKSQLEYIDRHWLMPYDDQTQIVHAWTGQDQCYPGPEKFKDDIKWQSGTCLDRDLFSLFREHWPECPERLSRFNLGKNTFADYRILGDTWMRSANHTPGTELNRAITDLMLAALKGRGAIDP